MNVIERKMNNNPNRDASRKEKTIFGTAIGMVSKTRTRAGSSCRTDHKSFGQTCWVIRSTDIASLVGETLVHWNTVNCGFASFMPRLGQEVESQTNNVPKEAREGDTR
jgi:hypothetical protein